MERFKFPEEIPEKPIKEFVKPVNEIILPKDPESLKPKTEVEFPKIEEIKKPSDQVEEMTKENEKRVEKPKSE